MSNAIGYSNTFKSKLIRLDHFGQTFAFKVEDGSDVKHTKIGSCCTILLIFIILAYTGYKIHVLNSRQAVDVLQAIAENTFEDDYIFGADQGLNVAVSISSINSAWTVSNEVEEIDPSYGSLRFYKLRWDLGSTEGDTNLIEEEIQSHVCSSEELGLSGTDHKFWQVND